MIINLDLQQHDAPSVFAAQLARVTRDELVEVVVGDVDFCPNRVVPLVGVADAYVARGFEIRFKVPPHSTGERALGGFNARCLNPVGPIPNAFGRVWRFDNAAEQTALVSALALELDKTTNLAAGVKQCFEWCLNEVTDNVLNHSRPEGGAHGYAMVQYVPTDRRLKICVFDTGIGLKASFVGSCYAPATPAEAIRMAVRKGVTNGKGQGNGLWGLHEMVKISKRGKLHIRSDGAEYLFDPAVPSESDRPCWTLDAFPGTTTVDFQMLCSQATSLQHVFGADYVSVDLWQEAREQADGSLLLKVAELADGFGSRESARKVRHLVENAIDNDRRFVVIDFAGVENCSSSFIDELLGLLVVKYGAATSSNFFKGANMSGLVAGLANLSVSQRLANSCVVSKIAETIRTNPGVTIAGIARAINRTVFSTRSILQKLREFGIVQREGARRNGHWQIADWVTDEVLKIEDEELRPVRIGENGRVEVMVSLDLSDHPELLDELEALSRKLGKPIEDVIHDMVMKAVEVTGP